MLETDSDWVKAGQEEEYIKTEISEGLTFYFSFLLFRFFNIFSLSISFSNFRGFTHRIST